MIDPDKTIKALEVCSSGRCEGSCPYRNIPQCTLTILADALALLKEQEKQIEHLKHDLAIAQEYTPWDIYIQTR